MTSNPIEFTLYLVSTTPSVIGTAKPIISNPNISSIVGNPIEGVDAPPSQVELTLA